MAAAEVGEEVEAAEVRPVITKTITIYVVLEIPSVPPHIRWRIP